MKRFLVFGGYDYYPSGGWEDYQSAFDTLEEAKTFIQSPTSELDWYHVVDTHSLDSGIIYI